MLRTIPDIYNVGKDILLENIRKDIVTHGHNVMERLISNLPISNATVTQNLIS